MKNSAEVFENLWMFFYLTFRQTDKSVILWLNVSV